jgi:hypothetical protein
MADPYSQPVGVAGVDKHPASSPGLVLFTFLPRPMAYRVFTAAINSARALARLVRVGGHGRLLEAAVSSVSRLDSPAVIIENCNDPVPPSACVRSRGHVVPECALRCQNRNLMELRLGLDFERTGAIFTTLTVPIELSWLQVNRPALRVFVGEDQDVSPGSKPFFRHRDCRRVPGIFGHRREY